MNIKCCTCNNSEFTILENRIEEFDFKKGTGKLYKDLSCDSCGTIFLARMDIEITGIDIDFVIRSTN